MSVTKNSAGGAPEQPGADAPGDKQGGVTTDTTSHSLEIYKAEYDRLKAEQTQRIQFRDNLLMAHLTVVGAVIGFIVANSANPLIAYAYLIIPWTSSIIGWTYLNNDILISNIRDYLRDELSPILVKNHRVAHPFGWEHQIGSKRLWHLRKAAQLFMDATTFSFPAISALVRLHYVTPPHGHKSFGFLYAIDALITALLFLGLIYWNLMEVGQKSVASPSIQSEEIPTPRLPAAEATPLPHAPTPEHRAAPPHAHKSATSVEAKPGSAKK